MPLVAESADLFIISRAGVCIFLVKKEILNSKKRVDRFGLNREAPVPLCLETL